MLGLASEKALGIWEALLGGALMSLPLWARFLDSIITGAHVIAALGGAIIAVHGVWRIWRKRGEQDVA